MSSCSNPTLHTIFIGNTISKLFWRQVDVACVAIGYALCDMLCCPCWHGNPVRQSVPREVPAICWTPLRAQFASRTLTLSKLQLPQSCSHCVSIAICRLVQAVLGGRVI